MWTWPPVSEPDIKAIDSADDPRIADYTNLTDTALRRRIEPERGLYMAESTAVIERALEAGHDPRSFLSSARHLKAISSAISRHESARGAPVYLAEDHILERITGYRVHRGALAAMQRPQLPTVVDVLEAAERDHSTPRIVVLEDIVDHTNVGAIFRSVAALGATGILISPRCADPLYRRSVRVSMGAVFTVPWTRLSSWPDDLTVLQESGYLTTALALHKNAVDLRTAGRESSSKIALILGTEGDGLQQRTIANCDMAVKIPMHNEVDSLNVAAASAVALWELSSS